MECDRYRDAILELADGTLGPVRRAELQTHLDICDDCRTLVQDLQKIRTAAESLDASQPPEHVWLQIAGRLRQEGRVQQTTAGQPRYAWLALAATLLLAVSGAVYLLLPGDDHAAAPVGASNEAGGVTGQTPRGNAAQTDPVKSIADDFAQAERLYQSAIVKLEEAAKSTEGAIDPETAAILTRNLQVIDQAIAESRTALEAQPQSAPARDSLFEALRSKVTLLQDTVALMNEMRKGNSAGAAQLLDSGKS